MTLGFRDVTRMYTILCYYSSETIELLRMSLWNLLTIYILFYLHTGFSPRYFFYFTLSFCKVITFYSIFSSFSSPTSLRCVSFFRLFKYIRVSII